MLVYISRDGCVEPYCTSAEGRNGQNLTTAVVIFSVLKGYLIDMYTIADEILVLVL